MTNYPSSNTSTWIEKNSFDWEPYRKYGESLYVKKNAYIQHEEQLVDAVFVVQTGRVRLCTLSPTGEEKTILVVGSNNLFGEASAMQSGVYITSSVASTDSHLLRIPLKQFQYLFYTYSDVAEFVCQSVSLKFKLLTSQVTAVSYTSAQYRVVKYLLELGETYGEHLLNGVRISIPFTHQEMANLVGTTRVTIAQIFRHFEEIQVLAKDGDHFLIPSLDTFRHLLEDPKSSHIKNNRSLRNRQ